MLPLKLSRIFAMLDLRSSMVARSEARRSEERRSGAAERRAAEERRRAASAGGAGWLVRSQTSRSRWRATHARARARAATNCASMSGNLLRTLEDEAEQLARVNASLRADVAGLERARARRMRR